MRVPIEAMDDAGMDGAGIDGHHPLKMRVPIEAWHGPRHRTRRPHASPSENEGPY